MFFIKQCLRHTFARDYCYDGKLHLLTKTHLKFIQPLYSRSEAEVANIAGERRLPVLIDKKVEAFPNINNEEQQNCNLEQTSEQIAAINNTIPPLIQFEKCS